MTYLALFFSSQSKSKEMTGQTHVFCRNRIRALHEPAVESIIGMGEMADQACEEMFLRDVSQKMLSLWTKVQQVETSSNY